MNVTGVSPCKDCMNRSADCHPTCADYLEWKVENNIKWSQIQEKKKIQALATAQEIDRARKIKKAYERRY